MLGDFGVCLPEVLCLPEVVPTFCGFPTDSVQETPVWCVFLFALTYLHCWGKAPPSELAVERVSGASFEGIVQALRQLQRRGDVPSTCRLHFTATAAKRYLLSTEGAARFARTRRRWWRLAKKENVQTALTAGTRATSGSPDFISVADAYQGIANLRRQRLNALSTRLANDNSNLRYSRRNGPPPKWSPYHLDPEYQCPDTEPCEDDATVISTVERRKPRFVKLWRSTRSSPNAKLPFHGIPSMAVTVVDKKDDNNNGGPPLASSSSSSLGLLGGDPTAAKAEMSHHRLRQNLSVQSLRCYY